MKKYDTIKFNKYDVIIKYGEKPINYFYILVKGKTLSYNSFYEKHKYNAKKGTIIGLISSITSEPYFSTVEAAEDTEVIKIETDSIININNEKLMNKIYSYLYYILENWLSKYYTILAKNKVDLYNKDDILTMANIYIDNGYNDVAYRMCSTYLELFYDENNADKIKNIIQDLKPIEEPQHIEKNIYKFKKGYCLYSEVHSSNNIYIIESGKVGIYSILNSKQIVRVIYSNGYMINGYEPILEYKPLLTTAIVLEDSIINIIKKNELIKMMDQDREIRINFIKMAAMKVNNAILKIKSITTEELNRKLIIIIYSILKMEILFNEEIQIIRLAYTIDDIKNMLNINFPIEQIYNALEEIKYVEFDAEENINITNVTAYLNKYEKYIL